MTTPACAAAIEALVGCYGLAVEDVARRETVVEAWARAAIAEGAPLPALPGDPATPWRERIAADAGFASTQLWKPRGAALLAEVVERVGLAATPRPPAPPRKLDLFAEEMRRRGEPLPRRPGDRQGYSPQMVAEMAGVSTALVEKNAPTLARLAADVGVEARYAPRAPGYVTLAQLRAEALRQREAELIGKSAKSAVPAELSNFKWALNKAARANGATDDTPAADALAGWQEIARGNAKLRQGLRLAAACLEQMASAHGLPEGYAEAIAVACDRAGITRSRLMVELGLSEGSDLAERPPTPARMPLVAKMETRLGVPPGTFSGRVRRASRVRVMQPLSRYPDELQQSEQARREVRAGLTDADFALPDDQFRQRCAAVRQRQVEQKTRTWDPSDAYILRAFPPQVEEEFARILAKKHKRWRPDTVGMMRHRIGALLGYLARPEPARPASVAGPARPARPAVPPDSMTLALLVAVPEVCERQVEWRVGRIAAQPSMWDVGGFATFGGWLTENAGMFCEWGGLADHLRPIPGLLTEKRIAEVRTDWPGACRRAARELRRLAGDYAPHVEQNHDRQERVAPLLHLPNPLAPMGEMLARMERERDGLVRGTPAWAIATRDLFYVVVQLQNGFRAMTLHLLDLTEFADLKFMIDRHKFKNWDSSVFKVGGRWVPYERPLVDVGGAHAIARDYLGAARPLLLDGGDCPALFVGKSGARLVRRRFDRVSAGLSARHLAERPGGGGVAGARPFQNHAFRDLLATAHLKRGGDDAMQRAADAIHDTIDSVEHYLRFVPSDRRARLLEHTAELLGG